MSNVDSPVFLVGSERSGTTLLRLMLDHHPQVAFLPESEFIVVHVSDSGAYPDMDYYRTWLRKHRDFPLTGFAIDENLDYLGLVNSFLAQKKLRDGKEFVGATVHYHFRRLHHLWPKARYIYLLRDGRDVANSVMRMGWAGNVYAAADWWIEAEAEWEALLPSIEDNSWIQVRYEDLIADTVPQLGRICAFLGVDYSERMFDYVASTTYGRPNPRLKDQWKAGMREVEVQLVESRIGDRLAARGYALSGYPRLSVSALRKRLLRLHSRLGAFLFRVGRFGIFLTLLEVLARRLGIRGAHAFAMRWINQIKNAHIKH